MRKRIILLIFVGLLSLNTARAQTPAPRNPQSAKACAICHYRWVDTFFNEGKGSDLVPYQSQKVVATYEMCMSCHDGSIMDSRARMTVGSGHKTGIRPPAGMTIPELFPLDETGRVECATCHTAHGVPSGPDKETTLFMRTSNKDSAMCRMCHPNMTGGKPRRNHPTGPVETQIPVGMMQLSAATWQKPDRIACETCHTAHGSVNRAYLIKSQLDASLCLACHTDKSRNTPDGHRRPGHVVNVRPVSAAIPQTLREKGARTGPAGEIICASCHKVHNSPTGRNLLLTVDDENSSLCLNCHADKQAVVETGHNLIKSAPHVQNLQGQTVAESGVCSACHLPHKPARPLAGGGDFTSQMCMSCHGTGNFAASQRLSGHSHPLGVTPLGDADGDNLFTPVRADADGMVLPLFDPYGVRTRNGTLTCATCHDPHRPPPDTAAGASDAAVGKDAKNLYLRRKSPEICAECHADKFTVADSKHNLRKTAPTETNRLQHKASETDLCSNCHLVHGGEQIFLWAKKIPDNAEFVDTPLCFSCHIPDGPASEKQVRGVSHPMNVSPAEKGLTTRLPLFDPRHRLSPDGRMTCYSCHEPHRWDPSPAASDTSAVADGDARNSFLRLTNSPAPQLCSDCHQKQGGVGRTDHDLTTTAPEAQNIAGQIPIQSGPCGVCHLTHNGKNQLLLWGQEFGRGNSVMETLCTGCHSGSGAAPDKIPAVSFHPEDIAIHNTGRNIKHKPVYFPLYHADSGKPQKAGSLSCPSCHNAHRWSPIEKNTNADGRNLEGDVSSSFLRNTSYNTICMDCHGPEALYRYQYFHLPAKR